MSRWLLAHLGTMLFIFAVVYTAYEVTVGIGSGILAHAINDLPAADRAAGSSLMHSSPRPAS